MKTLTTNPDILDSLILLAQNDLLVFPAVVIGSVIAATKLCQWF